MVESNLKNFHLQYMATEEDFRTQINSRSGPLICCSGQLQIMFYKLVEQ